jgi:hypothetical protein
MPQGTVARYCTAVAWVTPQPIRLQSRSTVWSLELAEYTVPDEFM